MPNPTTLYTLSNLSVATVKGEDALGFLQGQLSNDIQFLDTQPQQLSAYCTPKGRMLAIFNVLKLDDGYALIAPQPVLAKVLPRLKMFVMRAKVDIELLEDAPLFGLHTNAKTRQGVCSLLNRQMGEIYWLHNDKNRAFLLSNKTQANSFIKNLPEFISQAGCNQWRALDIKQGIPQLEIENYEALIPQSVNLDIVEGVNFKKGCYPGQEIIARVKYRGKPKTRMINASIVSGKDIQIAAPIYIDERESSVGVVINTAREAGKSLLNASVPVTHLTTGNIYLDVEKKLILQRLKYPYNVPI